MNIPKLLIRQYTGLFTSDYLDDHQAPPQCKEDLLESFSDVKTVLQSFHEQIELFSGLEHILHSQKASLQDFYGYSLPLEDSEIEAILTWLKEFTHPEGGANIFFDEIQLTDTSLLEHRVEKGVILETDGSQSLMAIARKFSIDSETIGSLNPYWLNTIGLESAIPNGNTIRIRKPDEWR